MNEIMNNEKEEEAKNISDMIEPNKHMQTMVTGISVASSTKKSIDGLKIKYAKPDKYTGNRTFYDSETAKSNVKRKAFANGKEVLDPYTNKELKRTMEEAKRKYGNDWQKHFAEADHKVPIKKIHNDVKKSAWISNDNEKNIVNCEENLQIVSREFNNAKRSRSNKEFVTDEAYLNKTGVELSSESKKKAVIEGRQAQKAVDRKIAETKIQNITYEGNQAGKNAAKAASVTTAIMSSVSNITAVIKGEKDVEEAVIDTASDTGKAAITAYGIGAVETVLLHTLKSTIITEAAMIAISTGGLLKQYINNEISIHDLASIAAKDSVTMIGATIGMSMGGIIGSAVGAMAASAVCNVLISLKQKAVKTVLDKKVYRNQFSQMSRIENEALSEIQYQKKYLEEIINKEFNGWNESFEIGFSLMLESARVNDFNGFADGLDKIMSIFNSEVLFHSQAEVEQFLFDDNVVFDF